jgi:cell division protein FtsZ
MIPYSRDPQNIIPTSSVKIIGLGGAGTNMLERIALDGMDGAELLALNTDVRTLTTCLAREKIQLGVNLTKGLGSGGDPELGQQAALEAEDQIRASIKDNQIIFLCVGLGGGTGSGSAPIITRIAREEGAFVVVFATMPFAFEGKRRRDQAETALNELAVLSNALVTFDNNRMGELVLAKQGIHEAFGAADHMIYESIKAVIRLVVRPGIINVGLDDLMSALRTNRSRCLFGSGIADGKDRAAKALRNALNSPLLDQGALLKDAQTVLVHLSGGENLTLFEIELLMQSLQKYVPASAHVLFGAAIDPAMGDSLSITLISALPEDSLATAPRISLTQRSQEASVLEPSDGFTPPPKKAVEVEAVTPVSRLSRFGKAVSEATSAPSLFESDRPFAEPDFSGQSNKAPKPDRDLSAFSFISTVVPKPEEIDEKITLETPVESSPLEAESLDVENEVSVIYAESDELDPEPIENLVTEVTDETTAAVFVPSPRKKPSLLAPWNRSKSVKVSDPEPEPEKITIFEPESVTEVEPELENSTPPKEVEPPKLKLGIKLSGTENDLLLGSAPRGRFEGETPNVFEGEDLDLPPFLRKKK